MILRVVDIANLWRDQKWSWGWGLRGAWCDQMATQMSQEIDTFFHIRNDEQMIIW